MARDRAPDPAYAVVDEHADDIEGQNGPEGQAEAEAYWKSSWPRRDRPFFDWYYRYL